MKHIHLPRFAAGGPSMMALLLSSALAGCGSADTGAGSGDGAEPEGPVSEAAQAVITPKCVTVQRGSFGAVADAQIARVVGKAPGIDVEANSNYGSLATAAIGTVSVKELRKTLLRFDLSFIPTASTVLSATVTVNVTTSGAGTVELRRLTEFWDESRVTYNNWKNLQDFLTPAVSFVANPPAAAGPRSFSIPALAQSWVRGDLANNGVILIQEGSFATTISTSEAASVALRPKLAICYTDVGHAGSATVSGAVNAASGSYSGVFTLSQSPGGNTQMSSPLHRIHGGVVGATQGP